jgi:hypothetical protein
MEEQVAGPPMEYLTGMERNQQDLPRWSLGDASAMAAGVLLAGGGVLTLLFRAGAFTDSRGNADLGWVVALVIVAGLMASPPRARRWGFAIAGIVAVGVVLYFALLAYSIRHGGLSG